MSMLYLMTSSFPKDLPRLASQSVDIHYPRLSVRRDGLIFTRCSLRSCSVIGSRLDFFSLASVTLSCFLKLESLYPEVFNLLSVLGGTSVIFLFKTASADGLLSSISCFILMGLGSLGKGVDSTTTDCTVFSRTCAPSFPSPSSPSPHLAFFTGFGVLSVWSSGCERSC